MTSMRRTPTPLRCWSRPGSGPAPQKSLFHKLDALTGVAGSMPAWMMSHPATDDRIRAIEENEARWKLAPED